MISLTERTILNKRTLGCICDHGTTECKDIITLCENNRGYCSVYVCNKSLHEILRLTALNDDSSLQEILRLSALNDDSGLHEILRLSALNDDLGLQEILRLSALNDGKTMHNDQNGLVVMFSSAKPHKAQETKPDRCRNMIRKEVA